MHCRRPVCDYCRETGKGRDITYDEAMEILQRAEDNGYVHQITNIDGEDKIFAICNCALGSCFALRTSQLFNTPNMSASAYRAHVDADKCVACGKCAEVCPAGAAKLGQKLCTKTGPVTIRSSRCRMITTGASTCGARTIRTTTRSSATSPAPPRARPPARRTSPCRATSIWPRRAAIWTRSSSSSRITRSRPSAAASATAAARKPAPAAMSTAPSPSTRSRSLSPSRSSRPTSATSRSYHPPRHRRSLPGEDRHHRRRPGRPVVRLLSGEHGL